MTNDQLLEKICAGTQNVFVHGAAGTGKSKLIKSICNRIKGAVCLAPTGLAAQNIDGSTIHSAFRLHLGHQYPGPEPDIIDEKMETFWKNARVLIIDEVSMVRLDVFAKINLILKQIRCNSLPFGNIRLMLFGDVFQLPPVIDFKIESRVIQHYYPGMNVGPYNFTFFNSDAFNELMNRSQLEIYELSHNYRQSGDEDFHGYLQKIRMRDPGTPFNKITDYFNTRYRQKSEYCFSITSYNVHANLINNRQFSKLNEKEYVSRAFIEPEEMRDDDQIQHDCPMARDLPIKEKMPVMFVMNDRDKRWVNGTFGKVIKVIADLDGFVNALVVETKKGIYGVYRENYEITRPIYDEKTDSVKIETMAKVHNFPVIRAWALSVHRCQGQTFYEQVRIDLGSSTPFAGLGYVALSRVQRLEDLVLIRKLRGDHINISAVARDFYQRILLPDATIIE